MSHLVHSERGHRMLATMPPYYNDDPAAAAVVDSVARELDRVEAMLEKVRSGAFPQLADDDYRLLGLWEFLVGLPVEPEGLSVEQRREAVAGFRRREVAAASDWQEALTVAMGTPDWVHEEQASAYRVVIRMPHAETTFTSSVVEKLARAVTPAHLEITFGYEEGFLLGISAIGEHAF